MKKKKLNVYNNITHFRKAQEHNNKNDNNIKDNEELTEWIKQSETKLNDIQHQLKDARKMVIVIIIILPIRIIYYH